MNIKIKEIKAKDLTSERFESFEGAVNNFFKESFNGSETYADLTERLKNTITAKGKVYGAFENGRLVGFCSIEHERFGSEKQYVELSSLYVLREKREMGVGRKLFETARSVASSFEAKKMYISVHSVEETQAFYKTMGCIEAKEYKQEAAEKPPYDCQLECETGYEQHSGMLFGMSIGMCFGMLFGELLFDNMAIGMSLGMMAGMCIGMVISNQKR